MDTQRDLNTLFKNFSYFINEKNRRYGDAALKPIKIFSKVEPDNQVCIRIDDKLSRIMVSEEFKKNDVADTFGYIALLMVSKGWLTFDEMLD